MATDVGTGDSELATLNVAPADGTTQAILTVTAPDGTSTPHTATGGPLLPIEGSSDTQQLWTTDQPITYTSAGHWVLHWVVTGTGEGAEDLDVYVVRSPVAGGPTWLPGRSRVANYVPHRTLERNPQSIVESDEAYDLTFTTVTIPSGVQVDRLIADGAAWVSARVTPLAASLYDAAGVCTALYAAASVERGWPSDDSSLARANDLEKRLDTMLADLVKANIAAGTGTDTTYGVANPVWSFPCPDLRYDYARYW